VCVCVCVYIYIYMKYVAELDISTQLPTKDSCVKTATDYTFSCGTCLNLCF